MAQFHRFVSARASHQATTPDEDALLYLCVFSLTLRADLEDNRDARIDRAQLTIRFVLAPYSTLAPFHFEINIGAHARRQIVGVACAFRPRAAVRLRKSFCRSHLLGPAHKMSHVYEYRRHQLRRGL